MLCHHFSPQLQRIRQFPAFHREGMGKKGEAFDFFEGSKMFLLFLDARFHLFIYKRMCQQLFIAFIFDALLCGVGFEQFEVGDNKCAYKFPLVANHGNLFDIGIARYAEFDCLRRDVFPACFPRDVYSNRT